MTIPAHRPIGWTFTWDEWNRYKQHWDGCAFCGGPQQTVCALIAWRWGGSRSIGNAVPACKACVKQKGQRLLVRWRKEQRIYVDAASLTTAEFAVKYHLEPEHARHLRRLRKLHGRYRARALASHSITRRQYAEEHPEPSAGMDLDVVSVRIPTARKPLDLAVLRRRNGLA